MATFSGILRANRNRPPAPAIRQRLTSGIPKAARRDATIRSAANTSSAPPARAGPSTAAMTGLARARVTNPPNPPRAVKTPSPRPACTSLRSAPAQKTGATPVKMPTHSSSSLSMRSMPSSIPAATAALTALRASGRLMVMTPQRPRRSKSTLTAFLRPHDLSAT